MKRYIYILTFAFIVGCGRSDHKQHRVRITTESLAPYADAVTFPRAKYGFTPLPTNGWMKVESIDRKNWSASYPAPVYDVMLHFYDSSGGAGYKYQARTVGLKKNKDGQLVWIGEQQLFRGPKTYTTVDGTFNEQITITFETEQMAYVGKTLKGTAVRYSGPDSRLAGESQYADNLTINQITPILKEWGYNYNIKEVKAEDSSNSERWTNKK